MIKGSSRIPALFKIHIKFSHDLFIYLFRYLVFCGFYEWWAPFKTALILSQDNFFSLNTLLFHPLHMYSQPPFSSTVHSSGCWHYSSLVYSTLQLCSCKTQLPLDWSSQSFSRSCSGSYAFIWHEVLFISYKITVYQEVV